MSKVAARIAALPSIVLFGMVFAVIVFTHLALLRLPYFWDEGGYYIPAALDFFHTGQLIPHYTNAHTPLPNILLGTFWHLTGFHILATRVFIAAVAAAAILAVFRLGERILDTTAAFTVAALTAVYPIWFAQSSLAHADIFAAAFTLWALAIYLPKLRDEATTESEPRDHVLVALLLSLAALSKETSVVQPATLAALQIHFLIRVRNQPHLCREHLRWLLAFAFPIVPLVLWFAYHHHVTGFTFGNPEYLRYNATANFTAGHILQALRYRFLHLFWQRNIWLPVLLAIACLFLPRRARSLSPSLLVTIAVLVFGNWLAFSVLGGALLTRYLLPMYPLILLVCVVTWRVHTARWPWLAAITGLAFLSALWVNPPTSFAPEDNLTYRDMIVVHQEAITYVANHYPGATVLTAWPVSADLFNPYLGYTTTPIHAFSIEDFTRPEILKAAAQPGQYDTAIVFTTHFTTPSFRRWLLAHPDSARGREFAATRDLTPDEIAYLLGGIKVWQDDRNGEWAAVLRFPRSYDAQLQHTFLLTP